MAKYVFVVYAVSPRDGGRVQLFRHFKTEKAAWEAIEIFWDMMVAAGDYTTIDVKRTIAFRWRLRHSP